jgi:hypothetical protein
VRSRGYLLEALPPTETNGYVESQVRQA